jgi:hypothetical protein
MRRSAGSVKTKKPTSMPKCASTVPNFTPESARRNVSQPADIVDPTPHARSTAASTMIHPV